jgi:parallel beta-helix repeat protein
MKRSLVAGFLLLGCHVVFGDGLQLHVATNGLDSADGSANAPFQTLARARDEIRRLKTAGALLGPATVLVHRGTYCLAQTFQLGPQDSGMTGAPITYRAYAADKPTLLGGRAVTGFIPWKGRILKADAGLQGITNYFRQLFFEERRQPLARYPNVDPDNPYAGGWAYVDGKSVPMYEDIPGEPQDLLHFKEQDSRRWSRPEEGEVFVFPRFNWWNNILPIKSLDPARRLITLGGNASYPIRPGDRYFVQNLFEELDAPGEWYLDRRDHLLYFWPPAPLQGKPVFVPTLRTILELRPGTAHVIFRGFIFECCEGTAIRLEQTTNCLIAASTIRNAGDYDGNGVSVEGGRGNGVVGNDIYGIGRQGILLEGGDFQTLAAGENYADNNCIHDTGVCYKQGAGIILNGVGNRASHNLIHHEPRYGIEFSGNDHLIEFNHIHHINLETADTGAIESWNVNWARRGTEIRCNYLHDVVGFGFEDGRWVSPHFAWGIYLDDGTCGTHVFGNIVARTPLGGVHIHGGRDNVIENNIFIDGASQQITYTGYGSTNHPVPMIAENSKPFLDNPVYREKYPALAHFQVQTAWQMAGNKFLRNIVYYHDAKAALSSFENLPFDQTQSDFNLFYHFGRPVRNRGEIPAASKAAADKLDQHSVVADPLFVAPARDDYRLRADSPAFKLGFQPIPLEKIGPYKDPLRASWPITEKN